MIRQNESNSLGFDSYYYSVYSFIAKINTIIIVNSFSA